MNIELRDLVSERGTVIIQNAVWIDGKVADPSDIPYTKAYWAMWAESLSHNVNMPTAFRDDLYKHDRLSIWKAVQEHGELCPFLWIVRPNGTHLCVPGWQGNTDKVRYHRNNSRAKAFYWNGTELDTVSWEQALKIAFQLRHG